jgi:DNA-binding LytR/AlgR family response regulator
VNDWRLLAVDDEPLALDDLTHLLARDARVAEVVGVRDGLEALRLLRGKRFDAVFLDINMPGLDGVELAGVLANLVERPMVVFVTAHEDRAADAYTLDAVDYVLKPLRPERLAGALDKLARRRASLQPADDAGAEGPAEAADDLAAIAVDDGRRRYFLRRDDVVFAEAHRDYVHLHTVGANQGVHVVRLALSVLETAWAAHGFLRVHRSYLVALRHVTELTRDPLGGQLVRVGGHDLPVSRRQTTVLRDRVLELARRDGRGPQ